MLVLTGCVADQAASRCALCRCGRKCQAATRCAGKSKTSCTAKHWHARCCVCTQPLRRCPHATPGQVRHLPSTRGARVAHQACQARKVHHPRCACKALVTRSGRPLRIQGAQKCACSVHRHVAFTLAQSLMVHGGVQWHQGLTATKQCVG